MLKRLIVISLVLSTAFLVVLGDKPEASNKKNADLKTAETKNKNAHIVLSKSSDKKTSETKVDKAEDRVDKISEKADTSSSYQTAGAPVAQGNLYYYYYPVAAYPVHADSAYDKVGSSGGGGGSLLGGIDTPLLFLLVPLVLLLAAVPLIALAASNTNISGRSFGSSRASDLDEKFGTWDELQAEVDRQLSKYMTALDSERCMDRIVCELGVKASSIPHKELFFSVVEWLAPEHSLLGYGRMTVLKQAATGKYTMDSCKKFTCNPPASITQDEN